MKTIEEEIWEYIDGGSAPAQRLETEVKIASDPVYHKMYSEFLQLQEMISAEELDEPSMSFTRNVMEQVKLEMAPVTLKTKVDHRIIYAISGFFILSILSLFIYALLNSNYTMPAFKMPAMDLHITLSPMATSILIKTFLFLDLALAFLYFDRYLRKTLIQK